MESRENITVSLEECRKIAETKGFDSLEFMAVLKNGRKERVRWLDAYFGLMCFFEVEEMANGHVSVDQIEDLVDYCIIMESEDSRL